MMLDDLPKRPKWEEPGSVVLPRYVFKWLEDDRQGNWTVSDVGVLSAFLSMFETGTPLIRDAKFEDDEDGERVLVCSGLDFAGGINPDDGVRRPIRVRQSIATLHRNGSLEVVGNGANWRVKLGPRSLKLREGRR